MPVGGTGADRFAFRALADSTVSGDGRDRIADFSRSSDGLIDLGHLDASAGAAGDQAFSFRGDGAFTGREGQVRLEVEGIRTVVQADVDGDRQADFAIAVYSAMAGSSRGA